MTVMDQPALAVLVKALEDRNINLARDDVTWAFESPQTKDAIEAWVTEHLNPGNLLTKEEYQLYIWSYKAGRVHASDAQHDGGRPLREDDFDAVINSLEESTAAIDRHTIQLEEQRNALAQLQALNRAPAQPSTSSGLNINDRLRTQAHLQTEDEDSIDDLRRRVTQAERQSKDDVGSLRTLVHNQLNQDDQLLKSLQTTMRALSAASPQAIDSSGIDKLCSRLVDLRSQCMQNHINSVYEKALSSATDNMYNNDGSSQATTDTNEVAGLEEELDSLMIEATAVLQMVVENEHRRTIDSALAESYFQADKQKQQRIDHARDTLQLLELRASILSLHAQDVFASDRALHMVLSTLLTAIEIPIRANGKPSMERTASAQRRAGWRPASAAEEVPTVMLALLRQHNIRLPKDKQTLAKIEELFRSLLAERKSHSAAHSVSASQTLHRHLIDSLRPADEDLERLEKVLYAYSPFGSVHLANSEHERRLQRLDDGIAASAREMRQLGVREIVGQIHDLYTKVDGSSIHRLS